MKTNYSFITIFLTLFLFMSASASDDSKRQEKLERILQKRTDFVVSKIDLTKKETEMFIPLYREYLEKRMIFINRREKSSPPTTEEEYRQKNDTYINNQLNKAALDRIYYEKFREVLPESKIYLLFQAEEAYKNELIKQIENREKKEEELKQHN